MCLKRQRLSPLPGISINLSDNVCASFLLGIEVYPDFKHYQEGSKGKGQIFLCFLSGMIFILSP